MLHKQAAQRQVLTPVQSRIRASTMCLASPHFPVAQSSGTVPPFQARVAAKPIEATVHIVVQWYQDKNPARAKEIDACLRFNLENPHVVTVHVLLEAH